MRKSAVVVSVSFLIALTGCQGTAKRSNMIVLGESMEPLRERFNAEKHRPRIVALFSPV